MNPADERAKIAQPADPAADSDDMLRELDQRLRATLKDFQRTSSRLRSEENLPSDDKLNEQPEDLPHTNHQSKPVEDLPSLIPRINDCLDDETSDRVRAIEGRTKGRSSRGFARYVMAICIGVAGTLAWQSYGEAIKQRVATSAPGLGWSPEAKHTIANWVQQLGWTKPPLAPENTAIEKTPQAAPVAQVGSEPATSTSNAPATPSLDQQQVQRMEADIAALKQTVEQRLATVRATLEQLAVGQDQVLREIAKLQQEIASRTPGSSPQLPAAPMPKPKPAPASPSRATTPPPSGGLTPLQLSPHP